MLVFTPLLALFAIVQASPVDDKTNNLKARVAPDNMVKITNSTDYCMIVPRTAHTSIGDSEQPVCL
jgi:hypothetical protein